MQPHRVLAVLLFAPLLAPAQVIGTLGNFDVVNNTGQEAHGFEIELEGLHLSDITDTFGGAGRGFPTTVERYGAPVVSAYANGSIFGVRVTYQASFAAGVWSTGTPSGVFSTPGESCWTGGGIAYGPSTPCDHFGVGNVGSPTKTTYSWLVEANPGSGVLNPVAASLPAPQWQVTPAPVVGAPPVVVARIQAPQPPEAPEPQFGTPLWVKVYSTELEDKVGLEELMGGNAKVEQARQHTEIEWQLLQTDPGNPAAGALENGGGAEMGAGKEAVLRRYEFYAYTGAFDPASHEAKPLFGDSHPDATEIGDFMGAQNVALNLNGNPVAAVPEAPSAGLMALGLGALVVWRRRQLRA
ncbi:PEP-CTERM sorting domain-containing protein [Pelomonas sp. P7]|uniref:PEP-CTERM sorting domain-containing protein n=1 Tax=Pelomonas caseinilytica TaxID=2906763 RepID=A0ABS8XIS7_9BURK|nr:PEP-CTERM sorting domain-containing protein [Pelomonas sp. P7]MCE4538908.1 PEP-CTERM sorting domain-containing protein [Pelomonas sp. P7]